MILRHSRCDISLKLKAVAGTKIGEPVVEVVFGKALHIYQRKSQQTVSQETELTAEKKNQLWPMKNMMKK